jgi:hypothetical protein
VVIVGKLASTMEGNWLAQDCEHKIVTDGSTCSVALKTVASEVGWDMASAISTPLPLN